MNEQKIPDYLRILIFNYVVCDIRSYYVNEETDYKSSIADLRSTHQTILNIRAVDGLISSLQIQTPQLFGTRVRKLQLRIDLNFLIAYGKMNNNAEVVVPHQLNFYIISIDNVECDGDNVFEFEKIVEDQAWYTYIPQFPFELISDFVISVVVDEVIEFKHSTPTAILGLSLMNNLVVGDDGGENTQSVALKSKKMDNSVIELIGILN